MELNTMQRPRKERRARRVGRGGKRGKTSGRGGKGQTARAGNKPRPEWRDIMKKIPKRRGFGRNRSRTVAPRPPVAPVPLHVLAPHFKEGEVVSSATLVAKGLLRRRSGKLPSVKILGGLSRDAALPAKLIFQNVTVSMSARGAIEKASGTIEIPKPVN